jgi:hypothetical protein
MTPGIETSEHAMAQDAISHAKKVQVIAASIAAIAASCAPIPVLTLPAAIVAGIAGAVATIATLIPMFVSGKYGEIRATVKAASAQTQAAIDAAAALKAKVAK